MSNRLWLLQFDNQRDGFRCFLTFRFQLKLADEILCLQHILWTTHKAERHIVNIMRYSEPEIITILLCESRSTYRDARQVNTLVLLQHASMHHLTHNISISRAQYTQFKQTIVEQNTISRVDILGQCFVGRRNDFLIPLNLLSSNGY